jgi:hypothetical protein
MEWIVLTKPLANGAQDVRGCKPEYESGREERPEEEDRVDLHRVRSFPPAGNQLGRDVLRWKSVSPTVIGNETAFVEPGNRCEELPLLSVVWHQQRQPR